MRSLPATEKTAANPINPFTPQISHYEQTSAFSLHDDDDGSIASWDVSPSCDYVALARSGGAVSLLTVSPRGSINHTRNKIMPFQCTDLARNSNLFL